MSALLRNALDAERRTLVEIDRHVSAIRAGLHFRADPMARFAVRRHIAALRVLRSVQ